MPSNQKRNVLLAGAVLVLSACGGGGGPDKTPDAFSFPPIDDAELGETYTASVKITGIDAQTSLVIEGGYFSLDGKDFISSLGAVSNNDTVTVMVTAANTYGTEVKATLTIGGVSADFVVTTVADTEAPDLAVHFPPLVSLTDVPLPGKLIFRGSATDNDKITAVRINGAEAEFSDGQWQFSYDVVAGEQSVEVVAEDRSGNTSNPVVISLTHSDSLESGDFGNGEWPGVRGVTVLQTGEKLIAGEGPKLFAFDLSTATGSVAYASGDGDFVGNIRDMARGAPDTFYLATTFGDHIGLGEVDITTGSGRPISIIGDGNGDDANFKYPMSLAVDTDGDRAYMLVVESSSVGKLLWRVDLASGAREPLSTDVYLGNSVVRRDSRGDRLLVAACDLFAVSQGTGERSVLLAAETGRCVGHLAVHPERPEAVLFKGMTGDKYEVLNFDLDHLTLSRLSSGADRAAGPELGYSTSFDVDWPRRVAYAGTDGSALFGDRITAIDLLTGYRVVVAMVH